MKGLIEFDGPYHVAVHVAGDDGEPLCDGRQLPENDLYGPHEVGIPPHHIDVCVNCRSQIA